MQRAMMPCLLSVSTRIPRKALSPRRKALRTACPQEGHGFRRNTPSPVSQHRHGVQQMRYATHSTPAPPSAAPKGPDGRGPSSGARPVASAPLNAVSQRVRQFLAEQPVPAPASASQESGAAEWAVNQLLSILLHSPVSRSATSGGAPALSARPNAQQQLHPLLCVRVLQRLGYAVCCPRRPSQEAPPLKGWATRHSYPALTASTANKALATAVPSSSSCGAAAPALLSSRHARHAPALAAVTAAVLAPLHPLLGDGTAGRRPHTQVVPVIPVMVEWWCTLPTREAELPLQSWLPWVVAQYRLAKDTTATTASKEREASNTGTTWGAELPPLSDLLPHLIAKLSIHLSDEPSAASSLPGGYDSRSELCAEQLSLLLGLCDSPLCRVLWWHGDLPLVRIAGVRRALQRAVLHSLRDGDGAAPQRDHDAYNCAGWEGEGGKGTRAEQTRATLPTSPSAAAAAAHRDLRHQGRLHPPFTSAPKLPVDVADDDEYRRLLLRLAALQHSLVSSSTQSTPAPSSAGMDGAVVLLSIQLTEALREAGTADGASAAAESDPDTILRFIQPLHEYVQLLHDSTAAMMPPSSAAATTAAHLSKEGLGTVETVSVSGAPLTLAQAPVRLTFASVYGVLTAVFQRCEALKRQSCCRYAAETNPAKRAVPTPADGSRPCGGSAGFYSLLPHKARLHALKSLCETLLRHVRHRAVSTSSAREATTEELRLAPLWFADVSLVQQEAVLRRLCGAARALVRVAMEERRLSLLEEGPEGSVLTASTVAAAQRSRYAAAAAGTTTAVRDNREAAPHTSVVAVPAADDAVPSPSHSSTPVPPVPTPAGAMDSAGGATVATAAAFERTLRTLAFRVVEPALWRLYESCTQWRVCLPLHVLRFDEWAACVHAVEGDGPAELHPHLSVMKAAQRLHESVGGRAGLMTAQQVLPHPGQQPVSALVEGVRLTALRCLVFDPACVPCADAEGWQAAQQLFSWALAHTAGAFFSVWQRTAQAAPTLGVDAASLDDAGEARRHLRARLGLLTLTLHVRIALLQERWRHVAGRSALPELPFTSAMEADPMTASLSPAIQSVLHCLTASSAPPAWPTRPQGELSPTVAMDLDEWSVVLPSESVWHACLLPPAGTPAGCVSAWELVESLEEAAAVEQQEAPTEEGEEKHPGTHADECVTWRWLSSPEAVLEAAAADTSGSSSTANALYLLPWTTLAQCHQPLRVYDESGQTRQAAQAWEAALLGWLTDSATPQGLPPEKTTDRVRLPSPSRCPTVRLVSIAEEVRFFAALQQEPLVQLSPTVRVVCEEVRVEAAVVAPAVRRLIAAREARQKQLQAAMAATATEEKGWYSEDDYDGLD